MLPPLSDLTLFYGTSCNIVWVQVIRSSCVKLPKLGSVTLNKVKIYSLKKYRFSFFSSKSYSRYGIDHLHS
jgi:hypothetical protein